MGQLKYIIILNKETGSKKAIIFDGSLNFDKFKNENILSKGFITLSQKTTGQITVCCYGNENKEDAELICRTLNFNFSSIFVPI